MLYLSTPQTIIRFVFACAIRIHTVAEFYFPSCSVDVPSPFRRHPHRSGPSQLICHGTIDPEALTDRNIPISDLQKQLQTAIDSEDYAVAAQLRDEIEYVASNPKEPLIQIFNNLPIIIRWIVYQLSNFL